MRAIIAALAVITSVTAAMTVETKAEEAKPVRVIEITRANAEASAALLAAAKNPTIGMPPQGRMVKEASADTAALTSPDRIRNARAELVAPPAAIEQVQPRPRVTQ